MLIHFGIDYTTRVFLAISGFIVSFVFYNYTEHNTFWFLNIYILGIHLLGLLNPSENYLVAIVNTVLLVHLSGNSCAGDNSIHHLWWLWFTSSCAMAFWISLLARFIEERSVQKIIPTFTAESGSMRLYPSPGKSMFAPPRDSFKVKNK